MLTLKRTVFDLCVTDLPTTSFCRTPFFDTWCRPSWNLSLSGRLSGNIGDNDQWEPHHTWPQQHKLLPADSVTAPLLLACFLRLCLLFLRIKQGELPWLMWILMWLPSLVFPLHSIHCNYSPHQVLCLQHPSHSKCSLLYLGLIFQLIEHRAVSKWGLMLSFSQSCMKRSAKEH